MEITINGQKADITLDTEKTVGEVLAGMEQWLAHSLYRLSGLVIDGKAADAASLDAAFDRDIAGVQSMDIITSSLDDLAAQGLERLREDIDVYEARGFDERRNFFAPWNESPQARIIAEQIPELYALCEKAFSGRELDAAMLRAIAEERLRELRAPVEELARCEPLIAEICGRLEDLPLDIQTGKDTRATETIQIFSNITGKVFRIYNLLKARGLAADEIAAGDTPLADYVSEFGAALKELLAAYEQRDAVLVGDLAEYELAPRLRLLYGAIKQGAAAGRAYQGAS
jgi:hypothetical protein